MIFTFWKKQTDFEIKKKLLIELIENIDISDNDKLLIIGSIGVISEKKFEKFYNAVVNFIENLELKEINEIEKNNFVSIKGMTVKEANKKRKEINSFNFILNNL